MNRVLNTTVQRTADHAAPEITLDPLEIVGGRQCFSTSQQASFYISHRNRTGSWQQILYVSVSDICCSGEIRSPENTYFCQAARQLACVPSSQLCVKLASGGDPTYAFNIRFTGEEVHGTSENFSFTSFTYQNEFFSYATSAVINVSLQVAPLDTSCGRSVRSYRVLLFHCCCPAPVLQPTVTRWDFSVSVISCVFCF